MQCKLNYTRVQKSLWEVKVFCSGCHGPSHRLWLGFAHRHQPGSHTGRRGIGGCRQLGDPTCLCHRLLSTPFQDNDSISQNLKCQRHVHLLICSKEPAWNDICLNWSILVPTTYFSKSKISVNQFETFFLVKGLSVLCCCFYWDVISGRSEAWRTLGILPSLSNTATFHLSRSWRTLWVSSTFTSSACPCGTPSNSSRTLSSFSWLTIATPSWKRSPTTLQERCFHKA